MAGVTWNRQAPAEKMRRSRFGQQRDGTEKWRVCQFEIIAAKDILQAFALRCIVLEWHRFVSDVSSRSQDMRFRLLLWMCIELGIEMVSSISSRAAPIELP